MRCLQSGAGQGSFELQPRVIFHKEASGPGPGLWLQGREVEEGPAVQLQACLGLCVCACVAASLCVCVCLLLWRVRSSQHPCGPAPHCPAS